MQLKEFDRYLRDLLAIDDCEGRDPSLNGVQVGDLKKEIHTIAFAVDASMESFRRAAEKGADLIFVHHGLLWSVQKRIIRNLYHRIQFLMANDLALYAVHLPLDMHPELGNNISIAQQLGLTMLEPFGEYKGIKIGYKGILPEPASLDAVKDMLLSKKEHCLGALPFGPDKINTIGIVSGGDPKSGLQAIAEGLDLFITGDASHEIYHDCLEGGINVLFAGHYATEVWGIRKVAERLKHTSAQQSPGSEPTGSEPTGSEPTGSEPTTRNTIDFKVILLDIPTGL
jgi:dinuclear metal center YbgI/SA1388 family protein